MRNILESTHTRPVPQQALPVRITGTGAYLPSRTVYSDDFDTRWGKASGWTAKQCGVNERHFAGAGESSSEMAAMAAKSALSAAGLEASQLDCIVSACSVMEQVIPCLASQVQHKLGLGETGVPAFDINATCLSFLVALDQLACAMAAGRYRRVLVVSSEIPSIGLNPEERATAPLFGDGAAAVILETCGDENESALLASHLETYGIGGEYCRFRAGGTRYWREPSTLAISESNAAFFEMDGRALLRLAKRQFPAFLDRLLAKSGLTLGEIALVVPHQASGRALAHLPSMLGIATEKIINILARHGNQVAASLPSALHHAISSGRLQRGDCFTLLGTGAGVSLGALVLRY